MTLFSSRASTRRVLALAPDPTERRELAAPVTVQLAGGPVSREDAGAALTAYLLDPRGGALLAVDDARMAWLDGPLFTWLGPGNAAPLDDQLAALFVGPLLARGDKLADEALAARFAPRADDAIALAVGALDLPAQAAALEALFAAPGPDADVLALSAVQCGRALAWSPHLHEWPIAERIVDALLARLAVTSPQPHLDQVMRALAPIARTTGPLGAKVRAAALAGLDALAPSKPSFLAQVQQLGGGRGDLERFKELPKRELARSYAFVLGYASPEERDAFGALRAQVLDRPDAGDLFVPFVDGLLAAGHVPAVTELARAMLEADEPDVRGVLGLAAALPLDALAPELADLLDAPNAAARIDAIAAVELLADDDELHLDERLAGRLADPSPEVCAAAARTLLARGRRDLVARHSAREPHEVRRAVVRAALGDLSVAAVSDLAAATLAGLDEAELAAGDGAAEVTPVMRLIADSLLSTIGGLEIAAELIGREHDAAGLLALAGVHGAERDVGVLAPPGVRARLAQVTLDVAMHNTDTELGTLALFLLARMSAGDETIADLVADALTVSDGFGAQMVAALGELRVATDKTAAALAPLLAPDQPIGARITAAAIAGRALPSDHPAWAHVRELLDLGTFARAAAWAALRDRARRQS
jgi:hypothetical protein